METIRKFLGELTTPVELVNVLASILFFGRFVVQWIASERKKEVVIPESFWWISVTASVVALSYGILKHAPSIVLQQVAANVVYGRNIVLSRRARARLAPTGTDR